jgi:hypothetical protein
MAKPLSALTVQGIEIKFYTVSDEDYISLTDMARKFNEKTDVLIANWLRNRNTVEFLGLWEELNNPNFNPLEFEGIKSKTGLNSFVLSVNEWAEKTGAIGLKAKAGRYGGTFAHRDIAFEFGSWLSPSFKLLLIKEFQRLKAIEAEQEKISLDWQIKRTLAKVNYLIHTDAVKAHLIPPRFDNTKYESLIYASEADILNLALFGITAKQWREANPELKGNIRDHASTEQLLVLANLENLNAEFIKQGIEKGIRLGRLNSIAIYQMEILLTDRSLKQLSSGKKKK